MSTLHILELPSEVLTFIFLQVPCADLVSSVTLVCKHFHDLLCLDWYWKKRLVRLTSSQPLIDSFDLRQWKLGCVQYESMCAEQKIESLPGSIGGLDCVHMLHPSLHGLEAVIAAGSRDSIVHLWRRRSSDRDTQSMRTFTSQTMSGHKGWVWSLASEPGRGSQVLCSGAWDHTVCVWDVGVGQNILTVKKQHKAAVLSLTMPEPNILVTACYDQYVRELDLRQPITVRVLHKQHTKPVLSAWANDRYVYTGSEDKTICVWDRRNQAQLQRVLVKGIVPSIYLDFDLLTAVSDGVVHVYDAKSGPLKEISSFSPDHPLALTSVLHNLGVIVTGSKDGLVKVHSASRRHDWIATFSHHHNAVTSLDYSRRTLAIASSDRTVSLLAPQSPVWST